MGVTTDDYVGAVAAFGEEVQRVGDTEWDLPTPCTDWTVQALVAHVVVGESQVAPLLAGDPVGATDGFEASILGTDPMSVWRGTALRAIEAVRGVADLDATVIDHPVGRIPVRHLLGFRVTDNLVHAWDVAAARGRSFPLPDALAETLLDFWLPLVPQLAGSDYFAPMVEPPPDPTPGERLLALLGRRIARP